MIKAQSLTRKYGDVIAVRDVSFEIGSKEIVGLLGHNGAGKTTIMKMMTGYLEPTSGSITLNGMNVWDERSAIQQQVGYLPENCPLYPEMTVLEYLDYAAALRGVPEDKKYQRIAYVIEKTNLINVARKSVSTLSRGYRQRLGVAQAFLNSPNILILDEPTNGLDPSQILEMRSLIKELAETATVVVSTHILQEVQAVCHRVIIINNGRLALDANLANLQGTGRVRFVIDKDRHECEPLISTISDLRIVRSDSKNGQFEYIVETGEKDTSAIAAALSRVLVQNDCQVYAIHPIVRDLESVFGEITAGGAIRQSQAAIDDTANSAEEPKVTV